MRAKDVLDTLQISRPTLKKYRQRGYIKASKMPSGHYDFDKESVMALKNQRTQPLIAMYVDPSMFSNPTNYVKQIEKINTYCRIHKIKVDQHFVETIDDNCYKQQLDDLFKLVFSQQVKQIVIYDYHQIADTKNDFELIQQILQYFSTKLIIANEGN